MAKSKQVNELEQVVQRSTGFILAGNHRWMADRKAGEKVIPVIWVDVDDDRAARILLADNRTSDQATYDEQALAGLLKEIQDRTGSLLGTPITEWPFTSASAETAAFSRIGWVLFFGRALAMFSASELGSRKGFQVSTAGSMPGIAGNVSAPVFTVETRTNWWPSVSAV